MADEHGGDWIKVPEDRVAELNLPEADGDDVSGFVYTDPFVKLVGGTTYVQQGSTYASQLDLGGGLYWK